MCWLAVCGSILAATLDDQAFVNTERSIECLAITKDGKKLAIGTSDGIVEVWNIETKKRILMQRGKEPVTCIVFHPTQPHVLFAKNLPRVFAIDYETNKPVPSIESRIPLRVLCVIGKLLAGGGKEGELWLYDYEEKAAEYVPLPKGVGLFAISGNRRSIAVSLIDWKRKTFINQEQAVYWLDLTSRDFIKLDTGHNGFVTCLRYSETSPTLFAGGVDGTVRSLQFPKKESRLVCDHKIAITAIDVRGDKLASASVDGYVKLWNAKAKNQMLMRIGNESWVPTTVGLSTDAKLLVGGFCEMDGKNGRLFVKSVVVKKRPPQ